VQRENCEISRSIDIPPHLHEMAAGCVPTYEIDISAEDEKLNPQYLECGLFYWIPSFGNSSPLPSEMMSSMESHARDGYM
jgi:hypothetical protein